MQTPVMYRKRLIPMESVLLDKDLILYRDESLLITAWKTIRPKKGLSHGFSCYYPEYGWKISRFYDHENNFMYWYCDIIDTQYDRENDTYVFTDLLADVILRPDGHLRVLDLDELAEAFEKGLLSPQLMTNALRRLNSLLNRIEHGEFEAFAAKLLEAEAEYREEN